MNPTVNKSQTRDQRRVRTVFEILLHCSATGRRTAPTNGLAYVTHALSVWLSAEFHYTDTSSEHHQRTPPTDELTTIRHHAPTDKNLPHPNILTCRDVANLLQNCCKLVRWCCPLVVLYMSVAGVRVVEFGPKRRASEMNFHSVRRPTAAPYVTIIYYLLDFRKQLRHRTRHRRPRSLDVVRQSSADHTTTSNQTQNTRLPISGCQNDIYNYNYTITTKSSIGLLQYCMAVLNKSGRPE